MGDGPARLPCARRDDDGPVDAVRCLDSANDHRGGEAVVELVFQIHQCTARDQSAHGDEGHDPGMSLGPRSVASTNHGRPRGCSVRPHRQQEMEIRTGFSACRLPHRSNCVRIMLPPQYVASPMDETTIQAFARHVNMGNLPAPPDGSAHRSDVQAHFAWHGKIISTRQKQSRRDSRGVRLLFCAACGPGPNPGA